MLLISFVICVACRNAVSHEDSAAAPIFPMGGHVLRASHGHPRCVPLGKRREDSNPVTAAVAARRSPSWVKNGRVARCRFAGPGRRRRIPLVSRTGATTRRGCATSPASSFRPGRSTRAGRSPLGRVPPTDFTTLSVTREQTTAISRGRARRRSSERSASATQAEPPSIRRTTCCRARYRRLMTVPSRMRSARAVSL